MRENVLADDMIDYKGEPICEQDKELDANEDSEQDLSKTAEEKAILRCYIRQLVENAENYAKDKRVLKRFIHENSQQLFNYQRKRINKKSYYKVTTTSSKSNKASEKQSTYYSHYRNEASIKKLNTMKNKPTNPLSDMAKIDDQEI